MYRSLLVPLDGSAFSEQSLPFALSIARRTNAAIHLLHVGPPQSESNLAVAGEVPPGSYLGRLATRLAAHFAETSHAQIRPLLINADHVAPAICTATEQVGADLVVMSTHGRGALGRFWLGSIAAELLSSAAVPLLLSHPSGITPGESEDVPLRHLLLCLDGSAYAEKILEPATTLGSIFDADYTLIRITPEVPVGVRGLDLISLSSATPEVLGQIRTAREKLRHQATNYLEGIVQQLSAKGLQVQARVEYDGYDPGTALLRVANEPGTDLIALATLGERGLTSVLYGSVARKVIHGSPVPILVQPAASQRRKP